MSFPLIQPEVCLDLLVNVGPLFQHSNFHQTLLHLASERMEMALDTFLEGFRPFFRLPYCVVHDQ